MTFGVFAMTVIFKALASAVAIGVGANRRCGPVYPFLFSLLFTPIIVIPVFMMNSPYKNREDRFVFLRDKDGNLVPALDNKGVQKIDPSNGKPMWLTRIKDETYYRERERKFFKALFVTPVVALLKYTVFSPVTLARVIAGAVRENRENKAESDSRKVRRAPKVVDTMRKLPDEVYRYYDGFSEKMTGGEQESVQEDQSEEKDVRESVYDGLVMTDGSTVLFCHNEEIADLKAGVSRSGLDGVIVEPVTLRSSFRAAGIEGERKGSLFTLPVEPYPVRFIMDREGMVSRAGCDGSIREAFDSLREDAHGFAVSSFRFSTLFDGNVELQCDGAFSLSTTPDTISLNHSGRRVASLRLDGDTGKVIFTKDCPDEILQRIRQESGVEFDAGEKSTAGVLDKFMAVVGSESNVSNILDKASLYIEDNKDDLSLQNSKQKGISI